MRRDSLFYQLFAQLPQTFFDLLGLDSCAGYRFDSIELKETSFRVDGVFSPPDPSGVVYFCEVQFQRDNTFYERFFAEIFLYLRLKRDTFSDWQAVVIYPDPQTEQTDITPYAPLVKSNRLRRVYLNELPSPEELPLSLGLMKLMTLSRAEIPKAAKFLAQSTQDKIVQKREVIIELITRIMLYQFTELSREEVLGMLGLTTEELKRTRFYQEIYTEGRQEGLQQGLRQGLQEGLHQGEAVVILRLLRRRFGEMPPAMEERIRQLSVAQIEALAEVLLDFTDLGELTVWLEQFL